MESWVWKTLLCLGSQGPEQGTESWGCRRGRGPRGPWEATIRGCQAGDSHSCCCLLQGKLHQGTACWEAAVPDTGKQGRRARQGIRKEQSREAGRCS